MKENYQLLLGECTERLQDIPDRSVHHIFCDPPYGVTRGMDAPPGSVFTDWNNRPVKWAAWWEQVHRVCVPGAAVVIMGVQPFTTTVIVSNIDEFKYEWIWQKSRVTGAFNAKKRPMTAHCNLSVFVVGGGAVRYYNGYRPDAGGLRAKTVVEFQSVEKPIHYSQKPIEMVRYFVNIYAAAGETVLDPFMGSGTTGVAALELGCNFIGIEAQDDILALAEGRCRAAAHKQDKTPQLEMDLGS